MSRPAAFATVLSTAAATLIGTAITRKITLREDRIDLAVQPEHVLAHLRTRFGQNPAVIAADERALVSRFSGRAGPFRYRTVEVVTFDEYAITFEHLSGPFATCQERFDLTPTPLGTHLVHRGDFRLRGGLWTWPLAAFPVKRAFEIHVHEHLARLRAEFTSPR